MIILIILGLIALSLIGIGITHMLSERKEYGYLDWTDGLGWRAIGYAILLGIMISGFCAIHANEFKDENIQIYAQRYQTLTYQLENNFYNKITNDGRAELMESIYKYNTDVIYGRRAHNSFWIGIWYPEDYNSLSLIELN